MKLIKAFKKTFKRSYKDANDIPAGDWEVMNKPDEVLFGKNGLFTEEDEIKLMRGETVEKANTFYRSAFSCEPARKQERVLTAEAQADKDDFECNFSDHGCTCFISPPCSYCTHPGNPLSLEDDSCWEMRDVEDNHAIEALNPSQLILLEWYQDNRDKVPEWAKWLTVDSNERDYEIWVWNIEPFLRSVYWGHPDTISGETEKRLEPYFRFPTGAKQFLSWVR